ncbi:MAG TPA: CARDB domain-containing protein [Gemmatimonadales bacterium]|nr:CARDB domain-containing protein [Gemmatimonadales bacterium]
MKTLRRRNAALAALAVGISLWYGCSDRLADPLTGPSLQRSGAFTQQDVSAAIAAQERHTAALLRIPGVVGTAVGLLASGRPAVRILLERENVSGLPGVLDGIPVSAEVTGRFMALSDPRTRQRPAPVGFSVGHPAITAGTIGARVRNASGAVFVLSNNHVLANQNDAALGDPALQPGPYDGGTLADQIGALAAFEPIDFSLSGQNYMDAAIAGSTTANLGNATPTDDGYGAPNSTIYGDANNDGLFDNKSALLNLPVQKYGRTTKLTKGRITGINATVEICYEVLFVFCVKSAYFYDQLIIGQSGFSAGGDSGSLIVTDDANKNPVALLFAGSSTETIANRIDLVLNRFGVTVDGGDTPPPPPPDPVTDVAVMSVSAPSSVTRGATVDVVVTVKNVGNQNVAESFSVTLADATDAVTIGTQTVAGLAAGATATHTFSWNTSGSSVGTHTLTASHALADDNAGNNQASTTSTVNAPSVHMHGGDLDGWSSNDGTTWSATVEITVHDANHAPLNGATVAGSWNRTGLSSNTCTTGELGGAGTCIVLFPGLRKNVKFVSFSVTSVTLAGYTYVGTANHDPDGSSNGTTQRVNRP